MLNWLVDNATIVCVILGLVAVAFLVALWTTRKRSYAIGLGVSVALIALFLLLTWVPSDRSQIVGAINEMGRGVRMGNADLIFSHISDKFHLGSLDKPTFRRAVEGVLQRKEVTDIEVWDFEPPEISRPNRTARIAFMVKPKGPLGGDAHYRCKATFVLDPDGQWRMQTFQVFNPFVDSDKPLQIPELPR
jgi:hypothetical protein